jgi:hypothetical protein
MDPGSAVTGRVLAKDAAVTMDNGTVTRADCTGSLDIEMPATAEFASAAPPGTTITGPLGAVTVTDTRSPAIADWTATASASDFRTRGGGTVSETVPVDEIGYRSGTATAQTGAGTFTPGQTGSVVVPFDIDLTPIEAFAHTGGTGDNTVTWNPVLHVNVPLENQEGDYTGTVTHSVA